MYEHTNRFAIAEIIGPDYEITYHKDNESYTAAIKLHAYVFLKKMPYTNEWKIYHVLKER